MKTLLLLTSLFFFTACSSPFEKKWAAAKKLAAEKDFPAAEKSFEVALKLTDDPTIKIEILRELSRIQLFETKSFDAALKSLEQIIIFSKDPSERVRAQLQIANVYLENLNKPKEAIPEILKSLSFLSGQELVEAHFKLAKAYFYLNQFDEALAEADFLLKDEKTEKLKFQILNFKANVLVSSKKTIEAAQLFRNILDKFPDEAAEASLPVTLAVTLEELKDYNGAIKVLLDYKDKLPNPETIDVRVMRLRERSKNAPGARGIRK